MRRASLEAFQDTVLGLNNSNYTKPLEVVQATQSVVTNFKDENVIPFSEKKDLDLVKETKEGRSGAFSELVKRHRKAMLSLVYKMTRDNCLADDVVQEALIKAYTKIDMFQGRSSFKSWLYRITVNTARNKLRSRNKIMVPIEDTQLSQAPKNDFQLFSEYLNELFESEIGKLPSRQRVALRLRIFEDLSFHEIALKMSCPYDTAKANYRHALLKLKKKLKHMDL